MHEPEHVPALFTALMDAAGDGRHHLAVNVTIHGVPVTFGASFRNRGAVTTINTDAARGIFGLLAIAASGEHPAGAALRTGTDRATSRAYGWRLSNGSAQPLTRAEVFSAYCTDPFTGEPVPPMPGVDYADAPPLHY